jgi:YD repeat-containing protein
MTSPVVTVNDIETAGTLETILKENPFSAFPVTNLKTKEYIGIIRRDQIVALLECGVFVDPTNISRTQTAQARVVMQMANLQETSQALLRDDDIYDHRTVMTAPRKGHRKIPSLGTEHSWLKDNLVRTKGGNVLIGSDEAMPIGSLADSGETEVEYDSLGNLIVKMSSDDKEKIVDIGAAMNRGPATVVQNTPLSKTYQIFTALGLRTLCVLGQNGSVVGMVTRSNLLPEYMESRTGLDME